MIKDIMCAIWDFVWKNWFWFILIWMANSRLDQYEDKILDIHAYVNAIYADLYKGVNCQ